MYKNGNLDNHFKIMPFIMKLPFDYENGNLGPFYIKQWYKN